MGIAAVKIKIMPESPDADLDEIEQEALTILENHKAIQIKFERQPIAFGLVALIASFGWSEELSTDELETELREIGNASSAEIIDFRRAFG